MQHPKTATIAIALVLFTITAAYAYWAMTRTYALPSIDGPYYYIQVNSILRTGLIEYADPPLTFYVFTAFALAIGNVTTGVLIGSAVFAGAASVAIYFLFKQIFKQQIPAIAAGLVTALAAEHISMSVNTMKNGFGVVFIIGVIYFLQRSLDLEKHSKWNITGAVGCFMLTLFSHVLDEGIALLFIMGYFLFSVLLKERKQLLKRYAPILLSTAAIAVLAFVLVPSYFGDFNKGIIFVSDVTSETTTTTQNFSPNVGVGGGWGVSNPWVYLFLAIGVGLTLYEWFRGDRKKAVLVGCASIIGIGLVLPFIPADFAWRFELMEFISVAVIVGYACAALTRLSKREYAVLAMIALLAPVALVGYQTASSFTPTITSQQYSDLNQMATEVPRNNSVLFIQNGGMAAYWPEAILNLQAVTNASIWQAQGYSVYVLEGSQNGGFDPGNGGSFGPPGGPGNQGPNVFQGGAPPNLQQGSGRSTNNIDLTNATLVYSGSAYSLYKLNS